MDVRSVRLSSKNYSWLKAVKSGNYIGWLLLSERNVNKYYPETNETLKGHLNQTRKNTRSTKSRPIADQIPLSDPNISQLRGKMAQDVYTNFYDAQEMVFSDQTGRFPTQSRGGHNYIMVMVEIDSNAILVEPLKSRKDAELTRAYK